MEIGLFQLENLLTTPTRFLLFDLRLNMSPIHPSIDRLLQSSVKVEAAKVLAHVRAQNTPLEFPLILLCETGKTSAEAALRLEAEGHRNVYVVEGGVEGLSREL